MLVGDLISAKRAQAAEAVVLSIRQDIFCGGSSCVSSSKPTVRFTTAQGEQVDAETPDDISDDPNVQVGRSTTTHWTPITYRQVGG